VVTSVAVPEVAMAVAMAWVVEVEEEVVVVVANSTFPMSVAHSLFNFPPAKVNLLTTVCSFPSMSAGKI